MGLGQSEKLGAREEGFIVLGELAAKQGVSIEQYLNDAVKGMARCVNIIQANKQEGKMKTMILFEDNTGKWEMFDLEEEVSFEKRSEPSELGLTDPFADDPIQNFDLPAYSLTAIDFMSDALNVSPEKVMQSAVDLHQMVTVAEQRGLGVIMETFIDDEYYCLARTVTS